MTLAEPTVDSLSPAESQATSPLAVDATGLSKRYGRRWALADVGFQLPPATTLLVGGRNGSGKSTLFRILATAIRPDGGHATIAGHSLADVERVRNDVALLGHYSYLYDSLTALENLRLAAATRGERTERDALVARLDEVGLASRADDIVSTFSAGMRKRLSLARFLVQKPAVALLDEPYAALDPPGFRLMDRTIERLKGGGSTVLLATHLIEHGVEMSDFGILLESGSILWSGLARDFPLESVEGASL